MSSIANRTTSIAPETASILSIASQRGWEGALLGSDHAVVRLGSDCCIEVHRELGKSHWSIAIIFAGETLPGTPRILCSSLATALESVSEALKEHPAVELASPA